MSIPSLSPEPARVDEPQVAEGYAAVLSQVAAAGQPLIVRRNGKDLAAVVPLEHLELIREEIAQEKVEKKAAQIDWDRVPKSLRPPQWWFDDDDNPFEPEAKAAT